MLDKSCLLFELCINEETIPDLTAITVRNNVLQFISFQQSMGYNNNNNIHHV